MSPEEQPTESVIQNHISQIRTDPAVLRWVSGESDLEEDVVVAARRKFFDRYLPAVYSFLRMLLRDAGETDEVAQQFAVRVMERSFRGYSPSRGRFRDYLKTTLRNMVTDHWRGVQRRRRFAGEIAEANVVDVPEPNNLDIALEPGEEQLETLLERTFARLREVKQSARPTFYEVLDYVARHPDQTSDAAAASLSLELSLAKPINSATLRQTLKRAREKFRELLLEELAVPPGPRQAEITQERLQSLGIDAFFKVV